jgi:hypothetical protein
MYTHERAVRPLVAKVYSSQNEDELIQNFAELWAVLKSMLESEELETDTITTAFYAAFEMIKMQSITIAQMKSQIEQLEQRY